MKISVCICTRNRPMELGNALRSLEKSLVPIDEIIVSDDSTDSRTKNMVQFDFPRVVYLEGPKRGLSPNRNHAINTVTGTHVLFIDDDVILAEDFLKQIKERIDRVGERNSDQIIVTGPENNNGRIIYPHDQSFLGYQNRKYKEQDGFKTIVINSTVFPAELFRKIQFDEKLVYGYEEVDIAIRAVHAGYRILFADKAINFHYSSEINRDYYRPHLDKSRLYVTYRRYKYLENKPLKALSFLVIAMSHLVLHKLKAEGARGISTALRTIGGTINMLVRSS